jgi:hypothetical protein
MLNDFTPRLQYTLAAIGVIGGVASLGYSVYKDVKAGQENKAATAEGNNLRRPFEQIQPEYYQNKNIATEQAFSGLPVDTKNLLQQQREKAFGTSSDALARSGGNPNDYARLNKIFDDSLLSEAAQDSQFHMENIKYLTGINKDLAGQKTTQWGVNEYQPFESKLKEIQDRKIAAKQNQNNAINEGIGSISAITTAVGNYKGTPKGDGAQQWDDGTTQLDVDEQSNVDNYKFMYPDESNASTPNVAKTAPGFTMLDLQKSDGSTF